jgi:hypothetical protein
MASMQILRDAAAMASWDADELRAMLDALLAHEPTLSVLWDLSAGEEWAQVRADADTCAKVRAPTSVSRAKRFALMAQDSRATTTLAQTFAVNDVAVVEVSSDFESPMLSIEMADLIAFVDGPLPPPHAFDPMRFVPNDLVFVTE